MGQNVPEDLIGRWLEGLDSNVINIGSSFHHEITSKYTFHIDRFYRQIDIFSGIILVDFTGAFVTNFD
jgi:hypothetical protein